MQPRNRPRQLPSRPQALALLSIAALMLALPRQLGAQDPKADALRRIMQDMAKSIVPVEFTIEVSLGLRTQRTLGNTVGVVASADGVVIVSAALFQTRAAARTRGATISKPKSFSVVLPDRTRRKASYLGTDEDLGLAFLRIVDMAKSGIEPVQFDLARLPAIAEEVVAVGLLPRSHKYATTFALARVSAVQEQPIAMYGTTVDLRPMLGCPVVTMDGKVIGIVAQNNVQVDERRGLNLLGLNLRAAGAWILPARAFWRLVLHPPKKKAKKGWLGIEMQALTPDIAKALGVKAKGGIIVSRVFRGKGFAAEKAGLSEEDIITHFDGKRVPVSRDAELTVFRQMVRDAGPKSQISLQVLRKTTPIELTLNLSETPKTRDEARKIENRRFGFVVSEITFDAALYLNIGLDTMGVLVDYIERGGWASLGGLRLNDVIHRIDKVKVNGIEDFDRTIRQIEKEKRSAVIPVLVLRGNETVFVRIEPDWR